MNSNLIFSKLPKIITRDLYFRLDTYEIVDMKTIDKDIDNEIREYYANKKSSFKKNIIAELTEGLEKKFITEKLNIFFDKSYLVKIKKGQDLDQVSKLADVNIQDLDGEEKIMFNMLNSYIRQVVKDRKNDYDKVIKMLNDKAIDNLKSLNTKKKTKQEEEYDEDYEYDLDIELQNSIEAEEDKANKINKYVDKTYNDMEAACHSALKNSYKEYYNQFVDNNSELINDRLHRYEVEILKNQSTVLKANKKNSIINLYKTLTKLNYESIKWIDDNKNIIMATSIVKDDDSFTVTSGKVFPSYLSFSADDIDHLERFGNTLTAVLENKVWKW